LPLQICLRRRFAGIVKLTTVGDNRTDEIPVSPPSLSTRNHQPRGLAVPPLQTQLSRRRGSAGRTRRLGVVRSDSILVQQVRIVICPHTTGRQGRLGDIWHVDEIFITIRGERHYLWRAVDQDGDVLDILVTRHRRQESCQTLLSQGLEYTREGHLCSS